MGQHTAKRPSTSSIVIIISLLMLLVSTAQAGNFAVSPIRLDYDSANRNGAITITNAAETELKVQISLYEWRQDEHGKDLYIPSNDLLYFPHLATIPSAKRQLVRAGLRKPANDVEEKSYRLFVEELPDNKANTGTRLAVAVRFGIPIFVKPQNEIVRGEITSISMEKSVVRIVVHNSGNTHFKIASITATADGFSQQIDGWYLLAGTSREYQINMPADTCRKYDHLDIVVKTERSQFEKALKIVPPMCVSK